MLLSKIKGTIIIVLICTLFTGTAYANNTNQDDYDKIISEVAPYLFTNEKNITRYDALISVMKILGVDKTSAYVNAHSLQEQYFYDYSPCEDVRMGYAQMALSYDIAYGIADFSNREFLGEKEITAKELMAFMLRCVKTDTQPEWDNIFELSIEHGLACEEEVITLSKEPALTKKYAYTLFIRFLNLECFKIYQTAEAEAGWARRMLYNEEPQLTYLQFYMNNVYARDDVLETVCGNCHSLEAY